jgi:hypothetical protein
MANYLHMRTVKQFTNNYGHIRNKIFVKQGENTNKKQLNKATGRKTNKIIRTL